MIPILEGNSTPFDTKNTEDAVEKKQKKTFLFLFY